MRSGLAGAVLGLDVLHHLPDPAAFFARGRPRPAPGGRLALRRALDQPALVADLPLPARGGVPARRRSVAPVSRAERRASTATPPCRGGSCGTRERPTGGARARPPRVGTTERVRLPAEPRLPARLHCCRCASPGRLLALDRWTAPLAPLTALRAVLVWDRRLARHRTMLKPRLDSWTAARIVAPLVSFVPFVMAWPEAAASISGTCLPTSFRSGVSWRRGCARARSDTGTRT